jgi:LPXTG-motif cell wall-anchored protein
MIRKLIGAALLLLSTSALVGPVAPASAGGGPSDYADCFITADPSTFFAGDVVTITGTGFEPNFETVIEFHSVMVEVATVTADAIGSFTVEVIVPDDADAGPHSFSATCDSRGNETTTIVTVSSRNATTSTTTPGGGPLPRTGSEVEPLVVAGGVALLAGCAFVLVAKRRRRSAA